MFVDPMAGAGNEIAPPPTIPSWTIDPAQPAVELHIRASPTATAPAVRIGSGTEEPVVQEAALWPAILARRVIPPYQG